MLEAVVFDLDQTLVNRTETFRCFLKKQYSRFSAEFKDISLQAFIAIVETYDNNGYTAKDIVYRQVCTELSLDFQEALFTDFLEHYGQEPVLFEDTLDVLEVLSSSYKLGLISNGRTKSQGFKLDKANLRRYFSAISISESVGVKKPSPVIFQHCLDQLNVLPNKAVYIGDHPEKDVQAARQAGLKGIWVRNEQFAPPQAADGMIDNLTELNDLLNKL